MNRTFCDGCNKDVTSDKEVWGIQIRELKHDDSNLVFHLCEPCNKKLMGSIESTMKQLATGKSK